MKEMGLVMQLFGDSSKFKEQTCSDLRVFIREGVGGRGSLLHGVISFSPHYTTATIICSCTAWFRAVWYIEWSWSDFCPSGRAWYIAQLALWDTKSMSQLRTKCGREHIYIIIWGRKEEQSTVAAIVYIITTLWLADISQLFIII